MRTEVKMVQIIVQELPRGTKIITIPKAHAEIMGLVKGDRLDVQLHGKELRVRKARK